MSANRFSGRPVYLQLRDVLAERIAGGEWQVGAPLPNETELARAFGVGVDTMRRALQALEREGVLARRPMTATFAGERVDGFLTMCADFFTCDVGQNRTNVTVGPVSSTVASSMEVARLGLKDRRMIHRVQRVRFRGDRPFMVEAVSVPAHLFPDLTSRSELAAGITVLAEHHGVRLGKAEERAYVACADSSIAEALRIASATPVLVLDRLVFASDGQAVEWRVGHCHVAHGRNART
jgi:GntR family transcriptional regulator